MTSEGEILDAIAGMGDEPVGEAEPDTEPSDDGSPGGDDDLAKLLEGGDEDEDTEPSKPKPKPDAAEEPPKPRPPKKLSAEELFEAHGDTPVKVKVDGVERTVSLKELKDGYSMRSAALKRMDEAARVKQAAEATKAQLMAAVKDPAQLRALMRKHGVDEKAFAYKIAEEYVGVERMSPQEQAAYWRKQEEESWETEKQRREREELEARQAKAAQAEGQRIRQQLPAVLEKHGLPKSDEVVKRLASVMRKAHAAGYQLDIESGAAAAKEELMDETKTLVGSMNGAQIAEWLGPEVMKKVRRYEVDRLRKKGTVPTASASPGMPAVPRSNGAAKRTMTPEQILDSIR